jgi:cytoskeletal protein CcmA (bactofilin family)
MFSDKENRNSERIETLIGEQCTIVGNLSGCGLMKIDGSIDGDVLWQDDVILGNYALYNGNITCRNAIIAGKIKGNIICDGTLTIETTGRINGDITVKNLVVREGGSFDGKCTMIVAKDASEVLDV